MRRHSSVSGVGFTRCVLNSVLRVVNLVALILANFLVKILDPASVAAAASKLDIPLMAAGDTKVVSAAIAKGPYRLILKKPDFPGPLQVKARNRKTDY